MIYEIKRGSTVIAAVRASGKQFKAIMSEDRVEMEFSLPSPVTFQIGDTVEVYGQTYKINRPSNIGRRFDKIGFTYQLEFEALYYDLGKWELKTLDKDNQLTESEVYMMSDAATMIDLIVRNANRVSSGWTVGAIEATEVMQFGYSNAKLLTVLQDLADKYNLEFWVTGKQINFGRNEASSGLTWEYGKANELYELRRDRSDIPVINRLTVLGGTRNLPLDYGHRRLQPADGNPITVPPTGDVVEQTVTFDNIYPHRVGTVSHVIDLNTFRDTSLDFNINNYLTAEPAKVAFTSGQLAGFTFTIAEAGYDHANRRITLNPITDDPAYPSGVPNAVLKPAVGDKYVLLDIYMPPSYVAAEEAKLQDIGEQYLDDYKVSHYNWSASLKPSYVIEDSVELVLGNTVRIVDTPLGIDTDIRISGFTRDLQEAFRYEVSLSNIITVSELVSQRNAQDRLAYTIQRSGLADGSMQTSETLQSVTRRGSVTDRAITVRGTRNTHLLSLPLAAPLTEDVVSGQAYIWFGTPGGGSTPPPAYGNLEDLQNVADSIDNGKYLRKVGGEWTGVDITFPDLSGYATQSWVTAGFAPISHTHPISQVTGLQGALDGKEPTFSKNTGFNRNFGTTANTVAQGNDSRINNGQTAFGWGNHDGLYLPVTGGTLEGPGGFTSPTPLTLYRSSGQVSLRFTAGEQNVHLGITPDGELRTGPDANIGSTGSTIWHSGNLNPSTFGTLAGANTWTGHNHFTSALSIPQSAPTGAHAGQAYIWFGSPGSGGGGGTSGTLAGLDDIALASLANNQLLRYNSSTGKWVNFTASYAAASHTHPISQITGLQAALDGKEPAFSKNTGFNRPFGTTANTVAQGNDSRIENGQTAFNWGNFKGFGLGTSADAIPSISEFNQIGERFTSFIRVNSVSNTPFSGTGSGIHFRYSPDRAAQLWFTNGGAMQFRVTTAANTWGAVNNIWHDGNLANGTTSQYIRGDGSLATFPTIGNGTLSMSTGTGLSGSASFSANQTGNVSFSVSAASGYVIPTTTQRNNWNTAYGWGNHDGLYLPLEGGTVGSTVATPLIISRDVGQVSLRFSNDLHNVNVGITADGELRTGPDANLAGTGSTIWHSDNLRSDGQNDSRYARLAVSNIFTEPQTITMSSAGHRLDLVRTGNNANSLIRFSADGAGNHVYAGLGGQNSFAIGEGINLSSAGTYWLRVRSDGITASSKITCPVIEASAIIVPATAPSSPESGKRYLWVS